MTVCKPLFMAVDIAQRVFQRLKMPQLPVVWIFPGMPVEYITRRAAVIRDDDPVMPRPAAVDRHIVMVHLKNDVLRCIVFDNGQIFPAEHVTSVKSHQ